MSFHAGTIWYLIWASLLTVCVNKLAHILFNSIWNGRNNTHSFVLSIEQTDFSDLVKWSDSSYHCIFFFIMWNISLGEKKQKDCLYFIRIHEHFYFFQCGVHAEVQNLKKTTYVKCATLKQFLFGQTNESFFLL